MSHPFKILPETAEHEADIHALNETVFGPGRFTKTAFRIRENTRPDPAFCFIALDAKQSLIGSARLTFVKIGEADAYLLGPLCVASQKQGNGIGRALVEQACQAVHQARALPVLLVGDGAYYEPLGFVRAPRTIKMPGPVDYARLLIAWPENTPDQAFYSGMVRGVSPP